jgi:hypothetical protein
MEGVELRTATRAAPERRGQRGSDVERRLVPRHALGIVSVTCGVGGGALLLRFRECRAQERDVGTVSWLRGGITKSSALFCSEAVACSYFLYG